MINWTWKTEDKYWQGYDYASDPNPLVTMWRHTDGSMLIEWHGVCDHTDIYNVYSKLRELEDMYP